MAKLTEKNRDELPAREFAFPKQRKEPIEDASHVRAALARFDQVEGVSNHEREEAFRRMQAAAKKFHVPMSETSWQELFTRNGKPVPKD
jgi:hypothetical protein